MTLREKHRPRSSWANPSQRFARGVQHYRQMISAACNGHIPLGTSLENAPVYLPLELLDTHVMIQATTGHGKTFLSRIIFRALAQKRVSIFGDDPKHDFIGDLEEDCAALGLDDRVTIFDTSDPARTPAWNPLKKNGIRVEEQTQWLLAAVRACFQQDNFDQTPQRPRWMFNALLPVIESEGTFDDVLSMLNYSKIGIRRTFIERTSNQLVREEWLGYEEQSVTRRRDETASSFAWMRKFCIDPTLRRIFTPSPNSFDHGDFLRNAGILLQSFPRQRPLDGDCVDFLRSLSLHTLLAYAFHIPLGERPPLYIFLDEAEHALERDTGVIETILNEGRSLGIHLILLFHNFAQVGKSNPALLESVLTNCRTKIIGGHLTQANLDILTSELFVNEWHPRMIRDEITALEVEPVEITRISRTRSLARSHEEGVSYPSSETDSTQGSKTNGKSQGTGLGFQATEGTVTGKAEGTATAHGTADTDIQSHSTMDSLSHLTGGGQGSSAMDALGSFVGSDGGYVTHASGMSNNSFNADGYGYGESNGDAQAHTKSFAKILSQSVHEAKTRAFGVNVNQSREESESTTTGTGHANSRGVTPSVSDGETITESETVMPFHELKKRWRVASREFLTLADFLATKLIALKIQPRAHFAVQPPEGNTVFFKATWVTSLRGRERLKAFRERVFSKLCYHIPRDEMDDAPVYGIVTREKTIVIPQEKPEARPADAPPVGPTTFRRKSRPNEA